MGGGHPFLDGYMNNKRQILLVEDSPGERQLIRLALNEIGAPHELIVVEDGQQAIDYLFGKGKFTERNMLERPELILLDLNLPKLTGFEVLKLIRANIHTTHIPVVIFTSSKLQADMLTGYQLGANSMITKPIEAEPFMECVKLLGSYWLMRNHPPPAK